nr:CHAT domain-containing protein [Rhizobium leguminosarum]
MARGQGDSDDNVERAIRAYEAALEDLTPSSHPKQWAVAQGNLGVLYQDRRRGDRSENIERSIVAHEAALQVYTQIDHPTDWAGTQMNLAAAYLRRMKGNHADNLEVAIAALGGARLVFEHSQLSRDWAKATQNLALAYLSRRAGGRSENIEKAIEYYELALDEFEREKDIANIASVKNSLGNAYANRIKGNRTENSEIAIQMVEGVLEIYTPKENANGWAAAKHNLANIYLDRMVGGRIQNLEKAADSLRDSLTVWSREKHPRDFVLAMENLAEALDGLGRMQEAAPLDQQAVETIEDLIGDGLDPFNLETTLADEGRVLTNAAWRAFKRNDIQRALEWVKLKRARELEVALGLDERADMLPPGKRVELERLRARLRAVDDVRDHQPDTAKGRFAAEAFAAESRALRDEIRLLLPKFAPPKGPDSVPPKGAIVVPLFVDEGGVLFLETANKVKAIPVPGMNSATINALVAGPEGWNAAYRQGRAATQKEAAIAERDASLQEERLADARHMRSKWFSAFDRLADNLWTVLGAPLEEALEEAGVAHGSRVTVLPQGSLSILPFWLARDPHSAESIFDRYEISISFSLARFNRSRSTFDGELAAWFNQADDLPFTKAESIMVPASFQLANTRLLTDHDVTDQKRMIAALDGWSIWHLSTHGEFDRGDARQAGLVIGGYGEDGRALRLTVADIKAAKLGTPPDLVVLAACESGVSAVASDQFIGLPEALIGLGVKGVVSSLWFVPDDSTTLLMAKFYELHRKHGLPAGTALRSSQLWLRNSTALELAVYLQGYILTTDRKVVQQRLLPLLSRLRAFSTHSKPYQHPFYWAAFAFYGHDTVN